MSRRPLSKQRLTGENFLDRQYRQAVTTGRSSALVDTPSANFAIWGYGGVLAGLAVGLAFAMGMMNPTPNSGMSEMISTKDGGLYVAMPPIDPSTGEPDENADNRLHEVRNLASARLITGSPDSPTIVGTDELREYGRGPQVGIDGAPNNLATNPSDQGSYWGMCDWRDTRSNLSLTTSRNLTTTAVAGDVWAGGDVMTKSDAILVRPVDEQSQLYILFGNHKAKVDADDAAMMDALGIGAEQISNAQVVSRGTLNSIPASPDMLAPNLNRSGEVSSEVNEHSVGDVLRTSTADGSTRYYAVLDDGVQRISEVVAEILVNHGGSSSEVTGGEVADYAQTSSINMDSFPSSTPRVHTPASVCMAWKRAAGSNTPETRIIYSDTLPVRDSVNDQAVETLPLADGSRPVADRVVTAPGRGWFAQVTGNGERGADEHSQMMYVSDAGVRFDLLGGADDEGDDDVRSSLGFTDEPVMIPDGVARMLPKGPDLSREAALVETVGTSDDTPEAGADSEDSDAPEQTRQADPTQTQDTEPDPDEVDDLAEDLIEQYGTEESSASREPDSPESESEQPTETSEPEEP